MIQGSGSVCRVWEHTHEVCVGCENRHTRSSTIVRYENDLKKTYTCSTLPSLSIMSEGPCDVCKVSENPMYSTSRSCVYILTPYTRLHRPVWDLKGPVMCVGCHKIRCIPLHENPVYLTAWFRVHISPLYTPLESRARMYILTYYTPLKWC